jgi:hypothetical protein
LIAFFLSVLPETIGLDPPPLKGKGKINFPELQSYLITFVSSAI